MAVSIIISIILFLIAYYVIDENYFFPQKLKKIDALLMEKDYEKALDLLHGLPRHKKIDPEIQYKIHNLYLEQSQFFLALFHLNEIVKRNLFNEQYNEPFIRMKIAELFEKMEKNKKALEEYKKILDADPDHYEANYRVGEKFYGMKNFDAAFPFLEKAYEKEKENNNLNLYLAEIYASRLEYPKALELTTFNIDNGDKNKQNVLIRGLVHLAMGQYPNCLTDMTSIEAEPVLGYKAKIAMAISHKYLSNQKEALTLFDNYLHRFNDDYSPLILQARYTLSDIQKETGELKKAVRQLQLIKNSGKHFENSEMRLSAYSELLESKLFNRFYEMDMETFINNVIGRQLTVGGQYIQRTELINPRCCFFTISKNISSGQIYRTVFGINMADAPSDEKISKDFVVYIKRESLTSGIFYSLFGLDKEAKSFFSNTDCEITLPHFQEFNEILSPTRLSR